MTHEALTDALIRLQKMQLDSKVQAVVEEAAQLLADGRMNEAEALIENATARLRMSQDAADSVAVPATASTEGGKSRDAAG